MLIVMSVFGVSTGRDSLLMSIECMNLGQLLA